MELSRNPKIHNFGKNELGDQLQYTFFDIQERTRGIEVALRLFADAYYLADGSGETIDNYDLAAVHNLMARCTGKLTEDMERFQEILFSNQNVDLLEVLNRYDAESDFPCTARPADAGKSE